MAEEQGSSEAVDARACVLPYPRVGDAYRELAAERLCEYRAGGFLDQDEFEARRDIILSAKTAAEVECMFGDLPGGTRPAAPAAPRKEEPPERRRRERPDAMMTLLGAMLMGSGVGVGGALAHVTWLYGLGLALMLLAGVTAVLVPPIYVKKVDRRGSGR